MAGVTKEVVVQKDFFELSVHNLKLVLRNLNKKRMGRMYAYSLMKFMRSRVPSEFKLDSKLILLVLLYGSESWTLESADEQLLYTLLLRLEIGK